MSILDDGIYFADVVGIQFRIDPNKEKDALRIIRIIAVTAQKFYNKETRNYDRKLTRSAFSKEESEILESKLNGLETPHI